MKLQNSSVNRPNYRSYFIIKLPYYKERVAKEAERGIKMKKNYSYEEFVEIIRKLRSKDGCPWDREQTHESLKSCLIEEAYEVIEGIDLLEKTKDPANLCEELGDVLLQVVMHSVIAEEEKNFTIQDVINGISEKMVRRHPHVFGDVVAETSSEVLENWEEIKKKEKEETSVSEGLARIPRAFPPTMRAAKVQKKVEKAGLQFSTYEEALNHVKQRLESLENARVSGNLDAFEGEFGDLLFGVVNLSRFLQLNVENSLTNATDKFINRFVSIEKCALNQGKTLKEMSIDEQGALWGRMK